MNPPPIELRQVTFHYPTSSAPVLTNVSLRVEPGEFVGIVGPTGSGKSTLLYLMAGIIPHYQPGDLEGEVRIFGAETRSLSLARIASRVGIVLQDPDSQLFNLLVRDELVWGLENRGLARETMRQRLEETCAFFDIGALADHITYDLSGGQKQRVALAAVHITRPDVLLLDNPTSQLDPLGSAMVIESIRRLRAAHQTVILVEDKIDELLQHADRLLLLHQGRILLDLPPRQLAAEAEALARAGIGRPQLAELFARLAAAGLPVATTPIDLDEAEAALRALGLDRAAAPSNGRVHALSGQIASPAAPSPAPSAGPASLPADEGRTAAGRGEASPAPRLLAAGSEPSPPGPILVVRDLDLVYGPPRRTHAVRGVSTSFRAGEMAAIIGQNGSGKTTLARCISGYLKPTRGRVEALGRDVHRMPVRERALAVGYVFQNPDHQIFRETVWADVAFGLENIGCPPSEVAARVDRILTLLGLAEKRHAHPYRLSKGDRQRLAIASIAVLEPRLLIIDEPTTGQDPRQARAIMDLLRLLQHERRLGVIVITHAMDLVADYCQRVLVMKQGQIILDGPPRAIFAQPERLAETFVQPPLVTTLALRLGLTPPPLNPGEAAAAFAAPVVPS